MERELWCRWGAVEPGSGLLQGPGWCPGACRAAQAERRQPEQVETEWLPLVRAVLKRPFRRTA